MHIMFIFEVALDGHLALTILNGINILIHSFRNLKRFNFILTSWYSQILTIFI